jgi:molybdopterin converting factor small subunit
MTVTVRLYANLPEKLAQRGAEQGIQAGSKLDLELPSSSRLVNLLSQLRLERGEVLTAFVNGRARDLEYVLEPGDEIGLFPPVGGG